MRIIFFKYIISFILLLAMFSSMLEPYVHVSAAATNTSVQHISAPSQAAPDDSIDTPWTEESPSVQKDVYQPEPIDPELQYIENKLDALIRHSEQRIVVSDDESALSSNNGMNDDQVRELMTSDTNIVDIYWIEYLYRLTNQNPLQIWKQKKEYALSWRDFEAYFLKQNQVSSSVSEDVYSAPIQTTSAMLQANQQVSIASTSSSLSSKIDSALDDTLAPRSLNQTNKQQYSDQEADSEHIDSSSGSLTWKKSLFHLVGRDGMDLNLGLMYVSNQASPYIRYYKASGEKAAYNYFASQYNLGVGWSFQFPSVQLPLASSGVSFYHDGHGGVYPLGASTNDPNSTETYSGLTGYPRKDLKFYRDWNGEQYTNGQEVSRYYTVDDAGNSAYFGVKGNLIGQRDRYGNEIKYLYQNITLANQNDGNTARILSQIIDSLGRTISFDDENTLQVEQGFVGEKMMLTLSDPHGKLVRQIYLTKSRYELTSIGSSPKYAPVLQSITDSSGDRISFDYDIQSTGFSFKSRDIEYMRNFDQPYLLLKQIQQPRLITNYTYDKALRNFAKGVAEEFRVKSRNNQAYQFQNGQLTPIGQYFATTYDYENDFSGYPQYYYADDLPADFIFSTTVHDLNKQLVNRFNGKHQQVSSQVTANNGEQKNTTYVAYDPIFTQFPTQTKIEYQDAIGKKTYIQDAAYTDWGSIQNQTDALTEDDYNNADTKARHTVTYAYEPTYHQVTSKTWYQNGGAALTEKYAYTGTGRLQSATNALGETTTYSYDASPTNANQIQRMTQQKSIRSGVTSSVTTTYGADYSYAYPTEQTSTFTNADQTKRTVRQTMTYDPGTGLLTSQTDSDGNTTTTTYDALGRPIKVTQPSMTNLDGTVYAIEDQYAYTNRVYSTGADSTNAGILTLRVDSIRQYTNKATGAVTVLSRQAAYYDGFGFLRVMETYNDTNGWTRSQYHPDDLGRAVYAIDAMGNTQTAAYDAWDQQSEFTDAEGNLYISKPLLTKQQTQHYTIAAANVATYRSNPDNTSIRLNLLEQNFDAYGHKLKVVAYKDGAAGHSQPIQESYTYDLAGNVLTYTDPNGNQNSKGVTTAYTYDALNRLTSVQDALDQTSSYTYDGGGGLSSVIISNPSGKSETLYTKNYNEQGLLTDKADSTSNHTQMNYNARSLTEQTVDRNGTSATYTYDERGQQTTATLKASSTNTLASGTMQVKSIYGSGGNILTDRHELYINDAKVATQTSTSDKLDRITSLSSSAADYAARLDASYDPLDRVNSQTSTLNGTSFLTNYGYDKSRLTQIQTNGAQARTTAATANVNYAYTPSGQVQQITFPTLSDGTTLQENMTYDPMNRLTRVSNTKGDSTLSVYNYQYDNNGNITSVTEQVKDGTPQTSTYSYDKLSRLTGVKRADGTETAYSYDLRGNRLTQKDTRDLPDEKAANYRYDLQNTLISVTKDSVKTALDYLPDGLRWKKTNGSKVTQYSYNGADQVIGDQTSNGTISSYIRGDRILVKKDLTNQKDYYYLYNGHGDVVQMVGTDGSLVNSYQYDEWGNLTQQKETVANEFKYAGETYDAETGLYYLKARYYDPNMGRFINEDTVEGQIDNPLTLNIYAYTSNNPIRYIDPTGHYYNANGSGGGTYLNLANSADTIAVIQARGETPQGRSQLLGELIDKHQQSFFGYSYNGEMTQNQFEYLYNTAVNNQNAGTTKWALVQLDNFFVNGWNDKVASAAEVYGLGGTGGAFGKGKNDAAKIGTSFGNYGTLVEHPGIKIDWSKNINHAMKRMAERDVTKEMADSWVDNGKALSQNNGSKYLFFSQKGAAVVANDGTLVTVIPESHYDDDYKELSKSLFGR